MACIDIAADLGCAVADLSKHIPEKEFPLWLARYSIKLGFTFDQEKIQKQRVDEFMARARKSWR